MSRGEGYVVIPEWMTPAQVEAVNKLYQRSPDGSRDRREFFTGVQECGIGSDRFAAIKWCAGSSESSRTVTRTYKQVFRITQRKTGW